ncbi:MAG: alpha/beta hydrolase [Pseudomonadota bacterium]
MINNDRGIIKHWCVSAFALLLFSTTTQALDTKTIEANGVEINYVEQGTGPLLILAHGALSDHRRWIKDHLPLFSRHYRTVAYSMRYHGTPEWDADWPPISMDLYADDLAALIQALDAGPAHLAGWSMGAMVAHRTALKYPDLVRSAYLFEGAAALNRNESQAAEFKKVREAFIGESLALASDKEYVAAAGALLDAVIGREGFFESLPEGPQKVIGSKGILLEDYFNATTNPSVKYSCEQIKQSTVPTAFVIGENTREYFAITLGEHYQPCIKAENFVNISNANHVWPGAKYEDFFNAVHSFASQH